MNIDIRITMHIDVSRTNFPSLWPSGIGPSALLGTEQVVSSIPGSVGYISHVHWAYDYLGPFGVLWVHMAWHKNCVKKNKILIDVRTRMHIDVRTRMHMDLRTRMHIDIRTM